MQIPEPQKGPAMKALSAFSLVAIPLALSACTTTRPAGPVEVTRFVASEAVGQLGDARLMVETAPGSPEQGLALTPFKAAVARELGAYGYIKEFDMERHVRDILVMPILGGSSAIQKNNICNMLKLRKS